MKKIFSELKLSKDDKDSITLLAVDNDVLWIPNYKTSDMYKANEDTKNVVYMYLKEERKLMKEKLTVLDKEKKKFNQELKS